MSQVPFHKNEQLIPLEPLPIVQRLVLAYKLWQEFLLHFPKISRHTLGHKIDTLFIEIIDLILRAHYLPQKEKTPCLREASTKLDILKFFLQIAWEVKVLDNKKFIRLSEH